MLINFFGFSWVRGTKPKAMDKFIDKSTRGRRTFEIWKNEVHFEKIDRKNFYPKLFLSFYKDILPIIYEKLNASRIQKELAKFDGFDRFKKIENILSMFDDSCEKIYKIKKIVTLATAGRYKGLDFIHVKHNFYLQSRGSRFIDLNTSHDVT